MLGKAPYRESLPETRYQRNPEKSQSRARCASRLAVMTDARLPMGARVLYALLDDYAGAKGTAWPKQATLAHRLGASRQSVQRWIAALERAGWLAIERTGRAHRYMLKWAIRASDSETGGHRIYICKPVVNEPVAERVESADVQSAPVSTGNEHSLELKTAEHRGPCPQCHGTGEREYRVPASIGAYGTRIPERRWRGKCGCRVMAAAGI